MDELKKEIENLKESCGFYLFNDRPKYIRDNINCFLNFSEEILYLMWHDLDQLTLDEYQYLVSLKRSV